MSHQQILALQWGPMKLPSKPTAVLQVCCCALSTDIGPLPSNLDPDASFAFASAAVRFCRSFRAMRAARAITVAFMSFVFCWCFGAPGCVPVALLAGSADDTSLLPPHKNLLQHKKLALYTA
jgi:hypothetical protein